MILKKTLLQLTTISLALLLAPLSVVKMSANANQPISTKPEFIPGQLLALQRRRLGFKVPRIRPSRNLRGGAARGNCSADGITKIDVVALMPKTDIGLTVAEKPTFLFRVSKTSVQEAQFKLLDEKGTTLIYEKTLPLTNTGEVRSFTLPADAPALEIGKEYQWELLVNCDPDDQGGNPSVRTAIKRVQPSSTLVSKLAQAKLSDRPDLYAQEGIWIDALSTLANLRVANPNNLELKEDWISLLESVGLQAIATMPVINTTP